MPDDPLQRLFAMALLLFLFNHLFLAFGFELSGEIYVGLEKLSQLVGTLAVVLQMAHRRAQPFRQTRLCFGGLSCHNIGQ